MDGTVQFLFGVISLTELVSEFNWTPLWQQSGLSRCLVVHRLLFCGTTQPPPGANQRYFLSTHTQTICRLVPCSSRRDSDRLAASTSDLGESRPCRHHCRGVRESSVDSRAFDDTYNLEIDTDGNAWCFQGSFLPSWQSKTQKYLVCMIERQRKPGNIQLKFMKLLRKWLKTTNQLSK